MRRLPALGCLFFAAMAIVACAGPPEGQRPDLAPSPVISSLPQLTPEEHAKDALSLLEHVELDRIGAAIKEIEEAARRLPEAAFGLTLEATTRAVQLGAKTEARRLLAQLETFPIPGGLKAELQRLQRELAERCADRLALAGDFEAISGKLALREALKLASACQPTARPLIERRILIEHPVFAESLIDQTERAAISLSPAERIQQAKAFERARENERAISELHALLSGPALEGALHARARFESLRIGYERLRQDFPLLAKGFESLRADPSAGEVAEEAALWLAKAKMKAGDAAGGRAAYQQLIKRWPRGRFHEEARFFIAFSHYEARDYLKAIRGLMALTRHRGDVRRIQKARGRPRRGWTRAAEWYFAWSLYLIDARKLKGRLRRMKRALPELLLAQAGPGLPVSDWARRATWWASRAQVKRAPNQARALRARLIEAGVHDWYGLLARSREEGLSTVGPFPYPAPEGERARAGSALERVAADPRSSGTLRIKAERLLLWRRLGLNRWADLLIKPLIADASQKLGWREGAALAISLDHPTRALRLAARSNRALATPPNLENLSDWRAAYPIAFQKEATYAAAAAGIPRGHVYSFIRKESAFQPEVVSPAQAMGLMQLLPKTGWSLMTEEEKSGVRPSHPPLFRIDLNLKLGARYLSLLGRRFHHQLPLVAAAYNAGPSALLKWLPGAPEELDLFVELIPYREAREYVKRLTASWCIYQVLYEGWTLDAAAQVALPLRLRLDVVDGVGY